MDYPRMSKVSMDSADNLTVGVGNSTIYGVSHNIWNIRGYSDRGDPEYMHSNFEHIL